MTLKPLHHEAREEEIVTERTKRQPVVATQRETRKRSEELLEEGNGSLPQLDEFGEVRIGRKAAIGLSKYASVHDLGIGTLMKMVEEANIEPIGMAKNGNRVMPVYPKAEVERLPYLTLPALDLETAEVTLKGRVCVSVSLFTVRNELAFQTLEVAIEKAKLKPFGKALSRGKVMDVYLKDQIEALPYVQTAREVTDTLSKKGEVLIDGQVCVGVKAYASRHGLMSIHHLKDVIDEAGLKPKGQARIRGMRICVDVYLKSEVDRLTYVRNNKKRTGLPKANNEGLVTIGSECGIVVDRYAKSEGFEVSRFLEAITNAGLEIIGKAQGKWKTLDVYRFSEVQNLPYVRNVRRAKTVDEVDENGEVTIKGVLCVSPVLYADKHGFSRSHFPTLVSSSLKPVGKGANNHRVFDVYSKKEVEALPSVQVRLGKPPEAKENGEVRINRIKGIVINKYAQVLNTTYVPLSKAIEAAGIEPIGKAKIYSRVVDVYPKKEVDALDYVKDCRSVLGELNDKGEVTVKGKTYVGIARYATSRNMGIKPLKDAVDSENLKIHGRARNGGQIVDVYEKSAVEALSYLQDAARTLNDKGEVMIGSTLCVAVAKFSQVTELNFTSLKVEIRERKLKAVGTARSGTVMVEVYAKEDIQRLPYILRKLGGTIVNDPEIIREALLLEAKKLKIPLEELLDPESVRIHIRKSPILHSLLKALADAEEDSSVPLK